MNVYVYYDVPLAAVVTMAVRVKAMQATLAGDATRVGLLRRPQRKPDAQTWMEVYEGVSPDFDARLVTAVAAHGLDASSRHVERFVEIG